MAGDEIVLHVVRGTIDRARADIAAMDKAAERAAMWSVREVARKFKQSASRNAPVYKGRPRTVLVFGERVPLQPRELKKSIHSSKNLKKHGPGDFSVVVGPRGAHVHLHAARTDSRRPFLKQAYDEAIAQARPIHERALARALAKGRR